MEIIIHKEVYAIAKTNKPLIGSFAIVNDEKKITSIIKQSEINKHKKYIIKIEKDWIILTFNTRLPFELVGFLAKISHALAEEKISIFVISAYSTDHILIKKKNLARAMKKLKALGFKFIKK